MSRNGPWTEFELSEIVKDYFSMLEAETAGTRYVKKQHNRDLRKVIGDARSAGSIEMKHMNISAVLEELGMPWIDGYKPFSNYQDAIVEAIGVHLGQETGRRIVESLPERRPYGVIAVVEVPVRSSPPPTREVERIARIFDPVERDAANRRLGDAGEEAVYLSERARLIEIGRDDLAKRVQWSSKEIGDGLGYDVRSFDHSGSEIFLEVKTTRGGVRTPFFMSRNEMEASDEMKDRYSLCRLHAFGRRGEAVFHVKPPLLSSLRASTEVWKLTP